MRPKRTGAEIIIDAAQALTHLPLTWYDDESKAEMIGDLIDQCAARVGEDFGHYTLEVVEAVARAACIISPSWGCDSAFSAFLLSQFDPEDLAEVLGRVGMGFTWCIYTCADPECDGVVISTSEVFNGLVNRQEQAASANRIFGMLAEIPILGARFRLPEVPRMRLLAVSGPVEKCTCDACQHRSELVVVVAAEPDTGAADAVTDAHLPMEQDGADPNAETLHTADAVGDTTVETAQDTGVEASTDEEVLDVDLGAEDGSNEPPAAEATSEDAGEPEPVTTETTTGG